MSARMVADHAAERDVREHAAAAGMERREPRSAFCGKVSEDRSKGFFIRRHEFVVDVAGEHVAERGDVEFVQSVYRLFAAMEIDWQEPLAQVIGDIPTQGLQQLFDGLRSFTRKTTDSARRNLDEYLHEESQLVPPLHQIEAFDHRLDDLRLRLDRLQARVQLVASGIDLQRQKPEG